MAPKRMKDAEERKPGSKEALEAGCKCPVIDNGHGRGSYYGDGIFIMSEDCPLHGSRLTRSKKENKRG